MPTLPTLPSMPMGIAAKDDAQSAPILPPLPMPSAPPAMSPQGSTPPPMPPSSVGPPPVAPPPAGPPAPPYQTKMQADGSVVAYIPSPDGNPANDVMIGVAPAFKVPRAFQQPTQAVAPQMPAPKQPLM